MSTSLIIRADATAEIGGGHVMRCLALANTWKEETESPAHFVTNCSSLELLETIERNGHTTHALSTSNTSSVEPKMQELLQQHAEAWVVVDGYHFDNLYYSAIRSASHRVAVIEDTVRLTEYDVDALLNPNVYAPELIYHTTRPCKELFGASYCLLRKEFVVSAPLKIREQVENLLITMGAADAENYTQRVLSWIAADSSLAALSVRVLAGPANPHLASLQNDAAECDNIEIVVNPTRVSTHMQWADVAVSAAGSTMWELCRLGVPALTTAAADNQLLIAKHLGTRGAAVAVPPVAELSQEQFCRELNGLISDSVHRQKIADTATRLVDGRGAARVVDALRAV